MAFLTKQGYQGSILIYITPYPSYTCCAPHTCNLNAQLKGKHLGRRPNSARVSANFDMIAKTNLVCLQFKYLLNLAI